MEQTILNLKQRQVIAFISQESKLNNFYLSGGTALAEYYFQHRVSDDLDFFSHDDFDKDFLHAFIVKLKAYLQADTIRFERLYDRNIFLFQWKEEILKTEFTLYPFQQIEAGIKKDGISIDSLRDIAANKLMALVNRFDPKDFVDLFFLLQKFTLETIAEDTSKKFGLKIDPIFLGSELVKVKRIQALPKMLKPLTLEELKKFFEEKAKELHPQIF